VNLIDFILNLAGLLLWLNWRSTRADPLEQPAKVELARTLRRAEPRRIRRWHFLAALAALLFVRAIFYWEFGSETDWTPKLNLLVVVPAFSSKSFSTAFLFSLLGFLRMLLVVYFWLLALTVINQRETEANPMSKMIQLQLGRVSYWPWWVRAVLPVLAVCGLWIVLHPLLVYAAVVSRVPSNAHLIGQGLLLGACLYFSLKLLLPSFLLVHLVASYVYLGSNPFWDFTNMTARNILAPLRKMPLRFGRVDFAPLIAITLLLLLLHALPNLILEELRRRNLTLWPQ
jgi:uncharacterized protein YggT (Ycf19 family)